MKILTALQVFFHHQAAGGIALVVAAIIALLFANSPWASHYTDLQHLPLFGSTTLHWVNDGLMVIFFFLIGLEIKREFISGELSSRAAASLPAIAAVGGMAVPALVYYLVNIETPENLSGWAIPAATDIAFAIGVITLLGSRVPAALKVLLTAIAVMDDLGAIIIIALFYTAQVNLSALAIAGGIVAAMAMANRMGVVKIWVYIALAICLWLAVLQSGVHATLAGVVAALFIPAAKGEKLEHRLHPYVAFGVLPVFAFANAGVSFAGMDMSHLFNPVTLGIALGLFVGKQVGIFASIWAAVKCKVAPMPADARWAHIYGVALLCGIGFTMSLFIGGLAFSDATHETAVKLGVMLGSVASAFVGYAVLRASTSAKR